MVKYNESLNISDIMRFIGVDHERTCILETESGKLFGVISQGDLIKAMWNGAELITPIANFVNPNPIYIKEDSKDKENEAIEIFIKYGILLIPVVSEEKKIIEILSVRKIVSEKYGS